MRGAAGLLACVVAVAAALGLGGCRTVQGLTTKPKVQSVTMTVVAFDLRKIELRFDVELSNPGDGEIKIAGYEYDLQIEGQPFLAGSSQDSYELAPHGVTRVPLPVTIAFADLRKNLTALTGRGAVSYNLAVVLMLDTPVGTFRFPLTKEGCVSLLPIASPDCRRRP